MRRGGICHAILLLVLFSLITGVIQLALVFLIGWGMLFRTRQTIGLLAVCFLLGLLNRHPWAGFAVLTLLTTLGLHQRQASKMEVDNQKLPPPSSGR